MPNPPPNAYSPTSESGIQSSHKISPKSNGQIPVRPTTLPVTSINAKKQSISTKSLTTNKQFNELRHISSIEFIDDESEVRQEMNDLKGKIWVADFIFTTCGGICPTMTANMAKIYRAYERNDLYFVSISVNPDNDTPAVLKNYAQKFHADSRQWFFLTGPMVEIQRLAVESFKLGKIDEPVFHSSYFTLVDKQGRIRGYYDGLDKDKLIQLNKDITFLLLEK